jgi:hypothetical protein
MSKQSGSKLSSWYKNKRWRFKMDNNLTNGYITLQCYQGKGEHK